MTVGTKSLLFGVHQFLIHPIIVAIAWIKLYGWPDNWRIWIAFIVHDWGYWGKPNMDGMEGETHPYLGASIMGLLFDSDCCSNQGEWYYFTLLHSRFLAKKLNMKPSRLCYADKMTIVIEPSFFYLPRAILSGEVNEYMEKAYKNKEINFFAYPFPSLIWHKWVKTHMKEWVKKNV